MIFLLGISWSLSFAAVIDRRSLVSNSGVQLSHLALKVIITLLAFSSGILLSGTIVDSALRSESLGKVGTVVVLQGLGALLALVFSHLEWVSKFRSPVGISITALLASFLVLRASGYSNAWYAFLLIRVFCGQWLQAWSMSRISVFTETPSETQKLNRTLQICATVGSFCGLGLGPIVANTFSVPGIFLFDLSCWIAVTFILILSQNTSRKVAVTLRRDPETVGQKPEMLRLYALTYLVWCAGGVFQVLEIPLLSKRYSVTAEQISFIFLFTVLANIVAVTLFRKTSESKSWIGVFRLSVFGLLMASCAYIYSGLLAVSLATILIVGAFNGVFLLSQSNIILQKFSRSSSLNAFLTVRVIAQVGIVTGSVIAQNLRPELIGAGLAVLAGAALLPARQFAALALVVVAIGGRSLGAEEAPFRVSVLSLPESLDPTEVKESGSALVLNQIFETLYSFDTNGAVVTNLVSGHVWSQDQLVLTVSIRKNIKFSDGSPLDAKSVVESLTFVIGKMKQSVRWAFGEISGFDRFVEDPKRNKNLLQISAEGSNKVVFRFKQIFAAFPQVLTAPYFAISKRKDVQVLGSGPYRVSSRSSRSWTIELQKLNNPWAPQKIKFVQFSSHLDAEKDALDGQIDLFESAGLEKRSFREFAEIETPFFQTIVIILNGKSPKLSSQDERCRFLSSFRQALKDSNSFWKPVSLGLPFSLDLLSQTPDSKRKSDSLSAPITISYADSLTAFQSGLIEMLEKHSLRHGARVKFVRSEIVKLLKNASEGEFEVALLGFAPDYPHPDALLSPLLASMQQFNFTGAKHPEIEELLSQARRTQDRETQNEFYVKVFEVVNRTCPIAFLGSQSKKLIIRKNWEVINLNPMGLYKTNFSNSLRRKINQ